MKPTAYKIGEGERKGLSKDMQEIILSYQEENKRLEEENKRLEEENEWFNKKIKEAGKYVGATMKENMQLEKENKKLRKNYYNLSKIVETTGGYKASYVNELRDKIAKLEIYKKQYKHSMGEDYIDEDLYDLDC